MMPRESARAMGRASTRVRGGPHPSSRAARAGAVLILGAALWGCASGGKHRDAELVQIEQWLPGRYENRTQVQEAHEAHHPAPAAVALVVETADALLLGRHVFFIEETSDDVAHEVIGQRLLSLDVVEGQIVGTVWVLNDPRRWREASDHPELFTSLQPPDVRQVRGCNLVWKKEGEKFKGSTDKAHCRTPLFGAGGANFIATEIELTSDDLAMSEARFDRHGNALDAAGTAPPIEFHHTG